MGKLFKILFELFLYSSSPLKFKLKGPDPKAIRAFFTKKCVDFLLEHPGFHMESNGKAILIFHKERVASVAEFKLMVSFARDWAKQI